MILLGYISETLLVSCLHTKINYGLTLKETNAGGVADVSGHMGRKMWGLIPVFDCSELLLLCPSHCKPAVRPIPTTDSPVDSPRRTMSGKTRRAARDAALHGTSHPDLGLCPGRTGAARTAVLFFFF